MIYSSILGWIKNFLWIIYCLNDRVEIHLMTYTKENEIQFNKNSDSTQGKYRIQLVMLEYVKQGVKQLTIGLVTTKLSDLAERFRAIPGQRVVIFDEKLDLFSKIAVVNPNILCVDLRINEGPELCQRLCQSHIPHDIALVVFGADDRQRSTAFEVGANAFLRTDAPLSVITQTLEGLLAYQARMLQAIGDAQCERDAIKQRYQHYHKLMETLSDELKNPLSIIYGSLSLLRKNATPQDQPIIDNTLSAVDDMRQILKNLADLNQLEANAQLHKVPVAWLECLQHCMKGQDKLATERDITLAFVAQSDDGSIALDRRWFEQIIKRLIFNAITRSPAGTTVTLNSSITPTQAIFSMTDQRTLQRSEDSDLAVIQTVIKQHDGVIWLENHPKYTITTIKLPVNGSANDPGLRPH